ncbi:MAG: cation:proton antiporter [Nanoarchaeota archaeon]
MENLVLTIVAYCIFTIIGGIIATKFKQPSIMGLLLMGLLIGPHALNIAGDHSVTDFMIEIGAVLLLFLIGLEFSISRLRKVGFKAGVIGLVKVGIVIFLTFQISLLLGFDIATSLILGVILSFSSTVVIIKVLEQKAMIHRKEIPLLVAALIVEDIIVVFLLAFFSTLGEGAVAGMQTAVFGLAVLSIVYWILSKTLKKIVTWTLKNSTDDITPYLALGLCGALSYGAYLLHLSPTIGAFLAGSVIASLPQNKSFIRATTPYVMMATSLFFIAMGTLVNIETVVENAWLILGLLAGVLIVRYVAISVITSVVANFRSEQAAFFSVAMFSVGEFSLLIARQASSLTSLDVISIAAAIVFISSFLMIFFIPESNRFSHLIIMPQRYQKRLYHLSGTVKSLLEGLDTDSRASTLFKRRSAEAIRFGIGAILVGALVPLGLQWERIPALARIIGYCLAGFVVAALLVKAGKRSKEAFEYLVNIYTSIEVTRQPHQARHILLRLISGAIFFALAIYSPFLLFTLELPIWSLATGYILIFISASLVRKVTGKMKVGITTIPKQRYFDRIKAKPF